MIEVIRAILAISAIADSNRHRTKPFSVKRAGANACFDSPLSHRTIQIASENGSVWLIRLKPGSLGEEFFGDPDRLLGCQCC